MLSPSPSSSATLGNPKADQIVHRFFTKLVLVVVDARATNIASEEGPSQGRRAGKAKVDKWVSLTPSQVAGLQLTDDPCLILITLSIETLVQS